MSAIGSIDVKGSASRKCLAIALMLAATLWTVSTLALGAYLPPERGEMGVVFPPWVGEVEAMRLIVEADGRIVGAARFSNIVVAYADDAGFAARVTALGALFVTAARGLCAPVPESLA